MDTAFVTGMAAFISSILIFCGSAFLLLMLILGARLAYWITASVTFGFVFIMGVTWSINPLGPVGQLPEWDPVAISDEVSSLEFQPATEYPEGAWQAPDEEDDAELARAAELEGDASDYFAAAVEEGDLEFEPTDTIVVAEDSTLLLTQEDADYGATTFEVANAADEPVGTVTAVLKYDPGNPLGLARSITAGTFIFFVLHLFGLSRAERQVKEERPEGMA
ncbi:MAG TPA: hypothetical protein VE174_00775 [Actinomycetota bacterium]|nr:hypothetical protein [Actinomycetota bacterium]